MEITTFMEFFAALFTGRNVALIGAALATILPGMGSAKGVGMVAEASAGVLAEDPSKFGSTLFLQAIPGTQGIYGFVTAIVIIIKMGLLGTPVDLSLSRGAIILVLSLPVAFAGYFSAIKQARVAVAGISVVAKRPEEAGKCVTSAVLVEMYAILALLISILPIILFKF